VLSRILPMIENEAAVYGMTGKLASARSVDIPVLELEKDLAATKHALIGGQEGGARRPPRLHHLRLHRHARMRRGRPRRPAPRRARYPGDDPVPVTVNVAAALARSRLAHSKRAYPEPPKKNVVGYADIGIGAERRIAAE
jgi:allantoin racemase